MTWVRWRIFVNTLNKTSGRDALQRTALALDRLAPIALIVVLVPSAIGLGVYGVFAGYQLVHAPAQPVWFELPRLLLLVGTLAAVIGPILMPSGDRTNPVRLLLLPIPARALYVSQLAATLSDPWIFLQMPLLAAVPVGLLLGGAARAALLASLAGVLLAIVVIGIAATTTTLIQLVLRDRRRGEAIALIFIVLLPLVGLLPSVLARERRSVEMPVAAWIGAAARQGLSLLPSELYVRSVRHARGENMNDVRPTLAGLGSIALVAHAGGLLLFQRVLSSTATSGPRRATSMGGLWHRRIPGVSSGTSAVALALLRLALRSPRGRATLLAPLAFSLFFAVVAFRSGAGAPTPFPMMGSALSFAMLAAFLGLVSSIPISMNQFAVDRSGLTMTLLAPLNTREILAGKAIGVGLIAVPPALLSVTLVATAFGAGSALLWLSLALSVISVHVLVSPLASLLSILLPRVVNLNSVGSGSNAHQLAGFVGMLVTAAAALPCAALSFLAVRVLDQPTLAPIFLAGWCLAAFLLARLLYRPVEKLFDKRRESLAMLM